MPPPPPSHPVQIPRAGEAGKLHGGCPPGAASVCGPADSQFVWPQVAVAACSSLQLGQLQAGTVSLRALTSAESVRVRGRGCQCLQKLNHRKFLAVGATPLAAVASSALKHHHVWVVQRGRQPHKSGGPAAASPSPSPGPIPATEVDESEVALHNRGPAAAAGTNQPFPPLLGVLKPVRGSRK